MCAYINALYIYAYTYIQYIFTAPLYTLCVCHVPNPFLLHFEGEAGSVQAPTLPSVQVKLRNHRAERIVKIPNRE